MTELLLSHEPPRGSHSVPEWLSRNASNAGKTYSSEFERHVKR
jgi:hypothetical protein